MVRKCKAMRGMARAQAAAVFLEGVVQHPVQTVLNAPAPAYQVGYAGGAGVHGQVGDVVAHGTAHDRAGAALGASVPPFHGLAAVAGHGTGAVQVGEVALQVGMQARLILQW
jgi:hypothetical protein